MTGGLRIAVIGSRGIPARYGGFETFAEELAPRLVERGHEVTVYCRAGYAGAERPSEFRGVRLRYPGYVHRRSLETLSHEAVSIADSLRRKFDLHYFLGTRSSPLYVAVRAAGRRVVVHTDGLEWKRRKWLPAGRAYLRAAEWVAARFAADRLVTDSEAMRAYYRRRYGRDATHIGYGAALVDGVPAGALDPFALQPGAYHLVVARIEPENNVDLIVREFLESRSPRELVVVGGAGYASGYEREVLATERPGRVRFLGPVYAPGALEALYAGARSLIHGHEVGGTNPSLVRAMGCGACVLALDTEFNVETLEGTGKLWSKRPGALAAEIRRADEDDEWVRTLGSSARERAASAFAWDAVAIAHDRLFREVAASGRGRRG